MSVRSSLMGSKLAVASELEEEIDPQSGILNMADVMLVFAVALLVAVITFWQVDMTEAVDMESNANIELLEGELEEAGTGEDISSDSTFTELGKVYRDNVTGEMYIVAPEAIE